MAGHSRRARNVYRRRVCAQPGSLGLESGQNKIRQPFYENWGISILKNIPFWREGTYIELGGAPNGFGALNSTREPRIVQIAAKIYF